MGNASSSPEDDGEDPLDPFDGCDTLGYRVLGVQPDSPAAISGLGVNDTMLLGSGQNLEPGQEYDDVDLPAVLNENIGKPIEFLVWNIKTQTARTVSLTPSDSWGGAGLLGVTIRLDNYAGAEERLVRVLQTQDGGPAATAGLLGDGTDYLLGTTHATFTSVDRLAVVLEQHLDTVVEVYVYNTQQDRVRVVALLPTYNWGGDGPLGAEVGTGYLHRLPFATRETEGTCVERKVRYVQGSDDATKDGATGEGMVELEPQLEMEPSDAEEESSQKVNQQIPEPMQAPPKLESIVTPSRKEPETPSISEPTPQTPKLPQLPPQPDATPKTFLPAPPVMGGSSPALGPPPQIYKGRPAYTDSRSAVAGYQRPAYIMPPPPQPTAGN